MGYPEITIVYPGPPGQQADKDQQETDYDKNDKDEVNDEYRICQQTVQLRVHRLRLSLSIGEILQQEAFAVLLITVL